MMQIVRARFFVSLLLLLAVEVFGEIAQDHLIERFVADEVFAEDRLAVLRPGLSEDRRGARRRIATLGRGRGRSSRRGGRRRDRRGADRARPGLARRARGGDAVFPRRPALLAEEIRRRRREIVVRSK